MPFGPPDIDKLQAAGDIEGLIKALAWSQSQVRRSAIQALARMGAPAARALCDALREPDGLVREAATEALSMIGPAAEEPLIAILEDPDPAMRKAAIAALVKVGGSSTVVALGGVPDSGSELPKDPFRVLGTVWDPDESVRIAATEAMGQLGDGRAGGTRCSMLDDSSRAVRTAAALAVVAVYRGGKIDEGHRLLILAQRSTITAPHQDHGHTDDTYYQSVVGGSSDCGRHTDYEAMESGIGVDFPV